MRKKDLSIGLAAMTLLVSTASPMTTLAESADNSAYEEEYLFEDEILTGTADLTEDEILNGGSVVSEEILSGTEDISRAGNATIQNALNKAEGYLQATVTSPIVNTTNGEWSVLAMARGGYLTDATKNAYISRLHQTLEENKGVLHKAKYTEYSRVVLALSSMNVNPQEVNGYNVLAPLANLNKVTFQGVNGAIYALLAFDAKKYDVPVNHGSGPQATRENLISYILGQEKTGGGWALSGNVADPDITAMAIQSLAPYCGRNDVKAAVDRGIEKLANMQDPEGGYSSEFISGDGVAVKNLESTAQVIIALSSVDASYINQDRFKKQGKTLLDELTSYQLEDGSFEHTRGAGTDAMATDQGTLALLAWTRAVNGQTRLYDMTDIGGVSQETESAEKVEAFRKKLEQLPKLNEVTLNDKKTIDDLSSELSLMKAFEEKEAFTRKLQEYKAEIDTQSEAVKKVSDRIWNEIKPLDISLKDKKTIDSIYAEYKALPKENQNYVERKEDLKAAKEIVDKLEKNILAKEIFELTKEARKNYIFQGNGYEICIKGKKVISPQDMKAGITIHQEGETLQFEMEETGMLPGEVELTIPCTLKDGVYMLYDHNNKAQQWVGISNGDLRCNVLKGGSYILKEADMGYADESGNVTGDAKPVTQAGGIKNTYTGGRASKSTETTNVVEAKVKNGVVEKKEFESVKAKDKNLKIVGELEKDKPYTFTINGMDIKTEKDFKIGLFNKSEYTKEIQKLSSKESYIFSFEEKGTFPGKMLVEMPAELKDGQYLLLHYNEKGRKAEYIQKVAVKENRTKFIVEKGGSYFLAKKASTKSVDEIEAEEKAIEAMQGEEILSGTAEKSSDNKLIKVGIGAIILAGLLGTGNYLRKKKQQGENNEKNE